MKKLLFTIFLLVLFSCTGEISSDWCIEWNIKPDNPINFSDLSFSFDVEMDKVEYFKGMLDSSGLLTQVISIAGHNHDQVYKINPNLHFTLQNNSIIIFDTTLTWSEMQFVKSHSIKEIVIKN